MQINLDSETVQRALEIAGLVAGGVIAVGGAWWKAGQWFHQQDSDLKALKESQEEAASLAETRQEVTNQQMEKVSDTLLKLAENVTSMRVMLDEREKATLKLEGAIDVLRKDFVGVVVELQKVSSNLDAIWRVMKNNFSDKVPRRMSDDP